jgi:succinyl-CoA synthetase beta subunit
MLKGHPTSWRPPADPSDMNIHDQAKQLFQQFNVATSRGAPAETPEEAEKMLAQTLITHQTGPAGKVVRKVLVAASVNIEREIYFAILMDRASGVPVVVASTEGGVEIEKVAEEQPEKIIREPVHPLLGLQPYQALKLGRELRFQADQLKAASKLFLNLYKLFVSLDCSLVEINPLVVTDKGEVLAIDAKFNFDDNALYRHKEILEMRDVEGTNVALGKKLLEESKLPIQAASDLAEAARRVVAEAKSG